MIHSSSFDLNAIDETLRVQLASRAEIFSALPKTPRFDILIIGGGIHGAAFARLAALNGLSVLLLERGDYACETSSRSSKLAHGGLRYLEMFDFLQVFEGIRAREELFEVAHHLVKAQQFVIPIAAGQQLFKYKLWAGLLLYDLMTGRWSNIKRRRFHTVKELSFQFLRENKLELSGCFTYFDGILNDSRLVLENILSARQEGAVTLNYAEVRRIMQLQSSGHSLVHWQDKLSGKLYESETGLVVNCAGPWVPLINSTPATAAQRQVCYSQGVHLLFQKSWRDPALFLPIDSQGRYYFVLPHFAGTLVGTTEREITEPLSDPQPTKEEIARILKRLARDLPGSGLDRNSLHYCFAGIRTLPLRPGAADSAKLSRRHIWSYSKGVLSLLGGKYTTYAWTVAEGLKLAYKLSGIRAEVNTLRGRNLPGSGYFESALTDFKTWSSSNRLPAHIVDRAIARLGSRVRFIPSLNQPIVVLGNALLKAEVELALLTEQAETIEDLMRRRLELEYSAGNGLDLLTEISNCLRLHRPQADVEAQAQAYRQRIAALRKLMEI